MEKAIAEIKSCHAVATTDVTSQNNKPRVDDMQVHTSNFVIFILLSV